MRYAGATGALTVRADSGFYAHAIVAVCRKMDVRFSITIRQHPRLRNLIEAIPETDWTPIPYWMDGAASVAETIYTPFDSQRRRTSAPHRPNGALHQLSYHGFITDREGDTLQLEADHRRHAEVENAIRDLKYGVGLNHLPSGRFAANAAWLAVQVMAHNLARWTSRIGLEERASTTKTLRRRFLPRRTAYTLGPPSHPASSPALALGNTVRPRSGQTANHSVTELTAAATTAHHTLHNPSHPQTRAGPDREYPLLLTDSSTSPTIATAGLHWRSTSRPGTFRTQRRHHTRTATLPRPSPTLRQRFHDSSVDSGLEGFTAQLRWADSWGGASKDLNLYLIPVSGGTLSLSDAVAISTRSQSGGGNHIPYETIRIGHGDITNGEYCLAVNQTSGAAPSWIQLLLWGASDDLQNYVSAHSIGNPAESRNSGMLAAGAAPFSNTSTIESFSSRGPTTDNRTKPDIVGADGGTSSSRGTWRGTSQASPHVAGLAALVKQVYPSRSPSSIASYLKDNALGRDTVPNNTWGYGFARLPPPPDATLSALTLSDIDFGTLTSDTTSYFASVANSVTQTTITPTLSDSDASYVIKIGGVTDEDGTVSLAEGINVITVEVTADDDETKKSYTVTVSRIGTLALTYKENGTASLHTLSANGLEQSTTTWSLEGTDYYYFTIGSTGILSFASSPDYESPGDSGGDNVYEVTVSAKDAVLNSTAVEITVTVEDVDEPPLITGVSTIDDYDENGAGDVATYTAIDPEGDGNITWSLAGPDRGDFDITGGVLTFRNVPDYERAADSGGNNHYEVTVQATDANNKRGELHIDVIVKNVDEPPVIAGPDTVDDYPENSAASRQVGRYTASDPEGATVTLSLTGTDSDDFTLAGNGVLTFKESPDYEEQRSYSVTVRPEGGAHTLDKAVTVNIQNVEEPGAVTLSTVQPQEGTGLTATLDDDDGPTGTTWQWYRTSSRGSTGTAITNSRFYTPDATDVGRYLRVVASYDDGHGDDKSATAVSLNRVQAAPPALEPPVFPANGDYDRSIRENQRAGSNVGAPVTATDGNNDRLTYSIATSDEFEIVESTGQLRTKAELDQEVREQHFVTVTATDPGGLTDTVSVTVTVEDVNETPVVSGPGSLEFEEGTGAGTTLSTYTYTDPDLKGIDLDLSGIDSEHFILGGGVLTFNEVPNFEEPADSNRDNRYQVTVEAREQGDGTSVGRLNVSISVTNVDEPGVLEVNVEEPRVGQTMRLKVEDEDGGVSVRDWKWERGDPNGSCTAVTTWESINSARSSSYTPTAADQGHCIRATAFYNDRAGTGRIEQFLTPSSVETGPFFTQEPPDYRVQEATVEGRSIGRVQAQHSNRGEVLTYRLSGDDARYFTIDSNAQLKTSATPLDYETRSDKDAVVVITAGDESGQTATITAMISVIEVNEGPEISLVGSTPGSVRENYDPSLVLVRYTATDPEGGTVSRWRTSGTDGGDFAINEQGELRFRYTPDYERPADSNRDNIYVFTVQVSDGRHYGTFDETVTVTPVDEPPTITTTSSSSATELSPNPPKGACERRPEEAKGCTFESEIMVLNQKTCHRKGAPNRCYHVTTLTASKSPSTIPAW